MAHGYSALQAKQAAVGVLDQLLMRQASMLSYNDAWMLILISFVVVSPAILLLRKAKGPAPSMSDAH
jgi:DHA2 family multidrug resistance protein